LKSCISKGFILAIVLMLATNNLSFAQMGETSANGREVAGRTMQGREIIEREIEERNFFDRKVVEREIIIREVLYRFGEYIDGIYMVDLRDQDYINSRIILETGEEINLLQILGNFAIGATVIVVTAIVMPYIAPTIAPKVLAITVANTTAALADGAINGAITYARSGGNINQTLVAASESFRSTTMFLSVGTMTGLAMAYRVNPAIRASRYGELIKNAERVITRLESNRLYQQINSQFPYYTTTNSAGHVSAVFAPQLFLGTPRSGWTSRGDLLHMGYELLSGDIGGHLLGNQFGGSFYWDNIVPMADNINRSGGRWFQMEQTWANALRANRPVTNVFIQVLRSTSAGRPLAFLVEYTIGGQRYLNFIPNK